LSISHLGNSFNSLPLPSGEARLRTQSSQFSPQVNEQQTQQQNSRRPQADIVQTNEGIQRLSTQAKISESIFRPIPSFDELPTSLRNALQTYLTTEQSIEAVANGGSELLVGIDIYA
jgi:hypothetical protein